MPEFRQENIPQHRDFDAQSQSLISIGPLVATLWQRKGLIAIITALFVGLAFVYISITPSTYTATGVIVIDPRQTRVLDSDGVLSGIGANSAAISSQVEIIQSRTLIEDVFQNNGYLNDPEFAKTRLLSSILSIIKPPEPATRAQIYKNFASRLDVERQGLTYILNVSFKSTDPQKAATIVNQVVEKYLASQVDEKSNANAQVSVLLGGQVEGLRMELAEAEVKVENFKEINNILSVGPGQTLLQSQIQQLSTQLVVAREVARAANNRYLQMAAINAPSAPLSSLFEILTSTSAAQLRADYNRSSIDLSSLQASLGPRHPNLVVAAAELTRLENLIRNEAQTVITQTKNEHELAQTNVINAEKALVDLRATNVTSNQKEVELRQLERQAVAIRQVLEQLINRAKETNQLETLQSSDARVISLAVAPISATWPKSILLLGVAGFFGLGLGGVTALYMGPKTERRHANQPEHIDQRQNYAPPPPVQEQYAQDPYLASEHDQQRFHERPHYAPNPHADGNYANAPYPSNDRGVSPAYTEQRAYQNEQETFVSVYYGEEDFAQEQTDHKHADQEYAPRSASKHQHAQKPRYAPIPEYAQETIQEANQETYQEADQRSDEAHIWSSRANGQPYAAPVMPNDMSNKSRNAGAPHQRTSQRASDKNMGEHKSKPSSIPQSQYRESFVTQLRRRMNQNAPR